MRLATSPVARRRALERGATRRELDALLRQAVLERDGYACRRCGAGKRPGRGGAVQVAHIKPKGSYPALRHRLENVVTLCAACHIYGRGAWHKDPAAAVAWALAHLGARHLELLELLAGSTHRCPDPATVRLYLERALMEFQAARQPAGFSCS